VYEGRIVTQPTERASSQEEVLIALARDGDEHAFGELVTRYQALAARVARFVAPGVDVDDVVQEAFVKAWYAMPRFRPGAPFKPWICRIAANEAKNQIRSARRREALVLRETARGDERSVPPPEGQVLAREEAEALVRAMNRLGSNDRLVLAYRWLLDLSEAEMADALAVPAGTVKSRLSRAMTKLRTAIVAEEVQA
jgi:RNA polymerase sigma factor (sigma-70 family)